MYEDKINGTENLEIGNPIISLLIDIRELPEECPIITGIVDDITRISASIVEISLGDMDITRMFMHADIEVNNATLYDVPIGDESIDDIIDSFNINENNSTTPIIELDTNTTIINDTSILDPFNRRRLITFTRSSSLTVNA